MPKSKRNKIVELTKTKKHGMENKIRLYEEIRYCVDIYKNIFVFSVTDMRNSKLQSVREQWKHSRFFIGKNKVMALALGLSPENEYRANLHKIGNRLKGQCGILFSNKSKDEVLQWFDSYSEGDFARSGNLATQNVTLYEGPHPQFAHSLEPYLRNLGLPTTLKKGVIHLIKDFEVCKTGEKLTPESARILKLMKYEMAEFHINVECVWSNDGQFQDLKGEQSPDVSLTEKKYDISMPIDEEEEDDDDDDKDMDVTMDDKSCEKNENTPSIAKLADDETKDNDEDENSPSIAELADDETKDNDGDENSPLIAELADDETKDDDDESISSIAELAVDESKDNDEDENTPSIEKLDGETKDYDDEAKANVEDENISAIAELADGENNDEDNEDEDDSNSTASNESHNLDSLNNDTAEDNEQERDNIVKSVLNDAKNVFSSPDDKSPVFRSLRNRTIQVPKSKKVQNK